MVLRWIFTALVSLSLCSTSNAQIAITSPAKIAGGVVAAEIAGKALKTCFRHRIACGVVATGAVVAGGAAVLSKAKNGECHSGWTPLYRVVDSLEYSGILISKTYVILPGRIAEKQFWLTMDDAIWFEGQSRRWDPFHGAPRYIVTSSVCSSTLTLGTPILDAGHQLVSFGRAGLSKVNSDAKRSGGIRPVKKFEFGS